MLAKRIIAWLDVKPPNLVKGIQMEGLRKLGDPAAAAAHYYSQGADEIVYMDVDASLDRRNGLESLVKATSYGVFVPITVGGGIRSVDDVRRMLLSGGDKVIINTAAVANPSLITDIAKSFGSQCVSVAIDYQQGECYTNYGREKTGKKPFDWAMEVADLGAGEIMLTDISREGRGKGYDCDFIHRVSSYTKVPIVAHGGGATSQHVQDAFDAGADGVALASALHYKKITIADLKKGIHEHAVRIA